MDIGFAMIIVQAHETVSTLTQHAHDLNELRTLQQVLAHGSLTGAARALGVSLAVISKRLATLEKRVGVRLVNRTTRSLSPTEEGERLLVEVDRALEAIRQGEELLATGREEPIGTLRVAAPVSFGRRHVAPVLAALAERHPRLDVVLSLDDRLVDIAGGTFDVAIRIGGLGDTSATMLKLADNRRVLAASPAYLDRKGRPRTPDDLCGHAFLRYGDDIAPWMLSGPGDKAATFTATPRLRVDSGDAVHDWCLAGHGIMMKSIVDMADDLEGGRLEQVLSGWSGGDMPVVALFASRRHQPRKLRVFIDAMAAAMHLPTLQRTRELLAAGRLSDRGRTRESSTVTSSPDHGSTATANPCGGGSSETT